MSNTKNVGQVVGLFIGTTAPTNTNIIWYDSTPNQQKHKVYDFNINEWVPLNPALITDTTYGELESNAGRGEGLSVGNFYRITDKDNVLAIAITRTKVQYPDALGNILIDDLGSNIQYHISSSNLLIDDIRGVYDTTTNKLVFSFEERNADNVSNKDYFLAKFHTGVGEIYRLAKIKIKSLISSVSGNSITWNKGFFFDFLSSLRNRTDVPGGVVGYDTYNRKVTQLSNDITTVGDKYADNLTKAKELITAEVTNDAIYTKRLPSDLDVSGAAGDVQRNDTLKTIIQKFQRWVNQLKFATGVKVTNNFTDANSYSAINNNDTVQSALSKLNYVIKHITGVGTLPSGWTTTVSDEILKYDGDYSHKLDDFIWWGSLADNRFPVIQSPRLVPAVSNNGLLVRPTTGTATWRPTITDVYHKYGLPEAGDTISMALAKLTAFLQDCTMNITLPEDWSTAATDSNYNNIYDQYGLPAPEDDIAMALAKLTAFVSSLSLSGKLSSSWRATSPDNEYVGEPFATCSIEVAISRIVGRLRNAGITGNKGELKVAENGQENSFSLKESKWKHDGGTSQLDLKNGDWRYDRDKYISLKDGEIDILNLRARFADAYRYILLTGNGYMQPVPANLPSNHLYLNPYLLELKDQENGLHLEPNKLLFQSGSYAYDYQAGCYAPAIFKTTYNTSNLSAALTAYNGASSPESFEAYFKRLKAGTLTLNTEFVTTTTGYYITASTSMIIWNGGSSGTIFLPNNPANGTMVWIYRAGSAGCNIRTQGNDRIDTINKSNNSISLSERGSGLLFIWVKNIKYESDPSGTTGLWMCAKLENQF